MLGALMQRPQDGANYEKLKRMGSHLVNERLRTSGGNHDWQMALLVKIIDYTKSHGESFTLVSSLSNYNGIRVPVPLMRLQGRVASQ